MMRPMKSTTVEIILYYLTRPHINKISISTTVEIILYYLTNQVKKYEQTDLQQ